ncbi:MAG: thiol:disulfide interchange protein DsbC [Paraglaciecola sp.]
MNKIMRMFIRSAFALLISMPVSYVMATDEPTQDAATQAQIKKEEKNPIRAIRPLPLTDGIMAVLSKEGKTTFASAPNARFAFKGVIYDSWTRKTITTLEQVNEAYLVPMEVTGIKIEDLALFSIGNPDKPKMGTIFVDPVAKSSQDYLKSIVAESDKYNFDVVMLATSSKGSVARFKRLWCSSNKAVALGDLILGGEKSYEYPSVKDCDVDAMIRTGIAQQILNIKVTPYTIRADGLMYNGTPKNLDEWLQYDIHAQEKK